MSLRTATLHDGAVERIWLARPKANVLDLDMIRALDRHLESLEARATQGPLRTLVLAGEGAHFSFGASVQEHLPTTVATLLPAFHRLARRLEDLGVPTVALVSGQCLGGGAELAALCGTVFCTPDARLGFPEVTLGVFPPLAAAVLPWRVGGARATELVVTGRIVHGLEARALGLADHCADDLEHALAEHLQAHVLGRSAVALRHAWRAVRAPMREALARALPEAEELYLQSLMRHADPVRGLQAFLDKSTPVWSHT